MKEQATGRNRYLWCSECQRETRHNGIITTDHEAVRKGYATSVEVWRCEDCHTQFHIDERIH